MSLMPELRQSSLDDAPFARAGTEQSPEQGDSAGDAGAEAGAMGTPALLNAPLTNGPLSADPVSAGPVTAKPGEFSLLPDPAPVSPSALFDPTTVALGGSAIFLGSALVVWALVQRARLRARTRADAAAGAAALRAGDQARADEREVQKLEARAEHLERSLAAADERIAELESQLAQARAQPATLAEPKPLAQAGSRGLPASHDEIYALADAGMHAVEIAQRTGRPTGQVELILNLRRAATVG